MPNKTATSRLKSVSLVLFILLVTAISVLIDFIGASFSTSIFTNVTYWLNVASVQSGVTILIFAARSLYKEKEMRTNETYLFLKDNIRNAFVTINQRNLNGAFRDYIATDNRERKLKIYREKINGKISKYADDIKKLELKKGRIEYKHSNPKSLIYKMVLSKISKKQDKKNFWEGRFERSEKEVDFVKIRYVKYSYSIIFNDDEEQEKEEGDPTLHEWRDISRILLTKGLSVFAFGVIATSFIVFDFTFSWGMVYKAFVKVFQILLGIYTGATDGQTFVRKKICSKLTTRYNYVKQFMEGQK